MDSYDIKVSEDLGDIELLKIEKKKYWMHDDWYCKYITVKTPTGDYIEFPCFRWVVDDKEIILRDGRGGILLLYLTYMWLAKSLWFDCSKELSLQSQTKKKKSVSCFLYVWIAARLPQHDKTRLAKQHRHKELENRQKTFRFTRN